MVIHLLMGRGGFSAVIERAGVPSGSSISPQFLLRGEIGSMLERGRIDRALGPAKRSSKQRDGEGLRRKASPGQAEQRARRA